MSVSIARGVSAEIPPKVIGITIEGKGFAITTGTKGFIIVPYNARIRSWSLFANTSGSAIIDIWKAGYPNIPTVSNSITGTDKPILNNQRENHNLLISDWVDSNINAEDTIGFNIDSVDGLLTNLTLILRVD